MGYLFGSQVESMAFTNTGAHYQPAGTGARRRHRLRNLQAGRGRRYAICGTPVRVWPERPFEPDAADAHDRCVAITRGDHA